MVLKGARRVDWVVVDVEGRDRWCEEAEREKM